MRCNDDMVAITTLGHIQNADGDGIDNHDNDDDKNDNCNGGDDKDEDVGTTNCFARSHLASSVLQPLGYEYA